MPACLIRHCRDDHELAVPVVLLRLREAVGMKNHSVESSVRAGKFRRALRVQSCPLVPGQITSCGVFRAGLMFLVPGLLLFKKNFLAVSCCLPWTSSLSALSWLRTDMLL